MMDDDSIMQCQLDLMHALQNRAPLRSVKREEVPSYIGGLKLTSSERRGSCGRDEPSWSNLNTLQAEFVRNSLAMHDRLRPKLGDMQFIREKYIEDGGWFSLLHELREAFRHQPKEEGQDEECLESETMPRMLFQLDRLIRSKPGWAELQARLRSPQLKHNLQPVYVDGFYVIKQPQYRQDYPEQEKYQIIHQV